MDLLNQFDIVLVLDGPGASAWTPTEKNVWIRYYRGGHGLGVIFHKDYNALADDLLDTLKSTVRVGALATVLTAEGKVVNRDTSSRISYYTAIETANTFYAWDTEWRWVNSNSKKERTISTSDDAQGQPFSDFTAGGTNSVTGATEVQGVYTNLIVWEEKTGDLRLTHVAFEPAVQAGGPSPYQDGDLPGRMFIDANGRTFKMLSKEGHFDNDQIRMLAKACIWLNRDSVPRSVLIYHTVENVDTYAPYTAVHHFYGLGRQVEEYMLMVPQVQMGKRLT